MANYRLTIEYDGNAFEGWQKHPGKNTVQGKLESVASALCGGKETEVSGAGRTDRGVSAEGQVASVRIPDRFLKNAADGVTAREAEIKKYFNTYLPEAIRVKNVQVTDDKFHARLCCTGKTYEYYVWNGEKAPVFRRKYVFTYPKDVDLEKMRAAAELFKGTHDFAAFATKSPGKKSTVRTISEIEITKEGNMIKLRFKGDGFLYNQIRITVGTILEVGSGSKTQADVERALETGERSLAGFTAPPEGLFLTEVYYR